MNTFPNTFRTIPVRLIALIILLAAPCRPSLNAQGHPAINEPDTFGWELFVEINQPVPGQPHVLWETWALAREVFADPDNAPTWKGAPAQRLTTDKDPLLQQLARRAAMTNQAIRDPHSLRFDPARPSINETRLNREAFDFVVDNDLYNIEGQELFHTQGRKIDFPIDAMEIKARWEPINFEQKEQFLTATVRDEDGKVQIWGLKALHITTKDLPNWFWATWEHTTNPGMDDVIPSVDRFRFGPDGRETQAFKNLIGKLGSPKWSNYVLRGTQVDFTDSTGRPTRLTNSIIEKGFQSSSSCITCHSRASIGPRSGERANRLPVFELSPIFRGSIGTPDHELFWDRMTGERKFTQTDFVWSLFRARRKAASPPQPTPADKTPAVPEKTESTASPTDDKPEGARARSSAGIRAKLESLQKADPGTGRHATVENLQPSGTRAGGVKVSASSSLEFAHLLTSLIEAGTEIGEIRPGNNSLVIREINRPSVAILEAADGIFLSAPPVIAIPDVIKPQNLDARDTHQVEVALHRHGVTGDGVTIGIWDGGGVRTTHTEFGGRATQMDSPANLSGHGSHVAGTVGAAGLFPKAKGMAPEVRMHCHDWVRDVEEMALANVACSNHSYGFRRGWDFNQDDDIWEWWGDTAISEDEDYLFGKYTPESAEFDRVAFDKPGHAIFVAAGNDRNDGPIPGTPHRVIAGNFWVNSSRIRNHDGFDQGGYDTIEGTGVAKNVITIGSIHDITTDPPTASDLRVSDFSSWGPSDDGRIKPDLVANGSSLFSTSAIADSGVDGYFEISGTSMATPAATGIAALLCEKLATSRSDLLKAALIHTAMNDTDGPNYRLGWGSIRADRAADLVTGTVGSIRPAQLSSTGDFSIKGIAESSAPIRVTLVWLDPPATPNTGTLDDRRSDLVHDLDLTVTGPTGAIHHPWSLDPTAPRAAATRAGANRRDNVERIDIDAPDIPAGSEWTIAVSGPHPGKPIAIAVTGLEIQN